MPFDMPVGGSDDRVTKTDFSQMSLADFLRDARVPVSLRDARILQIQKASQNNGEMKVSDFLRRDLKEEDAHLRKKQRELQDWLDAMRLRQLSAEIKDFIVKQKKVINTEIETIQETVNTLLVDENDHGPAVDDLRDARSEFKEQARELNRLEKARQSAKTEDELKNVQAAMQAQAKKVEATKIDWRQNLLAYWGTLTTNIKNHPFFSRFFGGTAQAGAASASSGASGGNGSSSGSSNAGDGDAGDGNAQSSSDPDKPHFDPL